MKGNPNWRIEDAHRRHATGCLCGQYIPLHRIQGRIRVHLSTSGYLNTLGVL